MENRRLVIDLLVFERGKAFGFQEYILNLLDYLFEHKKDILYNEIILVCKDSERPCFDKYEGFHIVGYVFNSYLKRFWIQTMFPIWLGVNKHDLLLSPGNYSGMIKRCPALLVVHDLLFKRGEWLPSRFIRLQRSIYVPHSIRMADRIIAISNFTKNDLEHFYPASIGKVEVIYNYMNFAKYGSIKHKVDERGYFLTISNGSNYKNFQTILKSFKIYHEKGGKRKLIFIGKIGERTEAGKVLSELPQNVKDVIIQKSNITNDELGDIYRETSCYISASLFEGLGMPVVEAMAFDLPVLLSDIPPHREISMGMGTYFSPTDERDLAEKMYNLDCSQRSYGAKIMDLFSETNTSRKYIDLINKIYVSI